MNKENINKGEEVKEVYVAQIKELPEVADLDAKINICVYNELHNQHYKEIQYKFWAAIDAIQKKITLPLLKGEDEKLFELSKDNLKSLEDLWYTRNPTHENNADSGEDMFWGTVLCVMRDYVASQKQSPAYVASHTSGFGNSIQLLEALESLCDMWNQYCGDKWGHHFMSAGEGALEVLAKHKLIKNETATGGEIDWDRLLELKKLNSEQNVKECDATKSNQGTEPMAHNSVDLLPVQVESAEDWKMKFFNDCLISASRDEDGNVHYKLKQSITTWIEKNILNQFKPDTEAIAMNIVNQLFDLAEVPVKKRQEINDTADEFVKNILKKQ